MLLAGLAIFAIILLKTATLRQVGLLLCASINCYLNCYQPVRHMYLMLLIFCLFLAFCFVMRTYVDGASNTIWENSCIFSLT